MLARKAINLLSLIGLFFVAMSVRMPSAYADVLYVDLNETAGELKVFQKWAVANGEKLVVLPFLKDREMYRSRGQTLKIKKKEISDVEKKILQNPACKKINWRTFSDNCPRNNSNYLKWVKLFAEFDEMPSRYHNPDLKNDLLTLQRYNFNFTTVVFSGHHAGGEFYGETSWLYVKDIPSVFSDLDISKNIKSVFLLGCNVYRTQNIREIWRQAFPKAEYLGGYKNVGYDKNSIAGHEFINSILMRHLLFLNAIEHDKKREILNYVEFLPRHTRYSWGVGIVLQSGEFVSF